jgi:hypothetical protein
LQQVAKNIEDSRFIFSSTFLFFLISKSG